MNNRDLRMATLKVQEARAQYRLTDADRYPQLNGEGSGSWSGNLKGDSATTREFSTGLNASFDLDFFGRLKNMSEAERQNYLATEEAQRAGAYSGWFLMSRKAISISNWRMRNCK
ncbi:copper/silver efflux system outer membrane protein CusC [Escherichia coli]|nr:copper/silver efflux system outer membrane protein CusC [Escherichia coli]